MSVKNMLDKGLEKIVSRKLLVWSVATGLAIFGFLTSSDWVMISALYIGGQTVVDSIAKMKSS